MTLDPTPESSSEPTHAQQPAVTHAEGSESSPAQSQALLTFEECRVLACLLEKEVSTPDYYPMTMNGLITACNQKSNRSPVVEWDEDIIEAALSSLRRKRLAIMIAMAGARVPKYKHSAGEVLDQLTPATRAVLNELMLRGTQTVGELRTNTERLHRFSDLSEVEAALQFLKNYPTGPLVEEIPPGGGKRVKTYVHLLCGPMDAQHSQQASPSNVIPPSPDWKAEMEARILALEQRLKAAEAILQQLQ